MWIAHVLRAARVCGGGRVLAVGPPRCGGGRQARAPPRTPSLSASGWEGARRYSERYSERPLGGFHEEAIENIHKEEESDTVLYLVRIRTCQEVHTLTSIAGTEQLLRCGLDRSLCCA